MSARYTAFLLPLLVAGPALAQQARQEPQVAETPAPDRDRLLVGAGAAILPSYEGSDNYIVTPIPGAIGRVSGFNFNLRGNTAWVDLVRNPNGPGWDFQLGPMASLNFNRTGRAHDDQVEALGEESVAFEAGALIGIARQGVITSEFDRLTLSAGYLHDVGTVHRSHTLSVSVDYATPLSRKAMIGFNASGDYMGDGYANTYFGVTPAGSAASGLPQFTGHKGWKDWNLAAIAMVSLTGDLTHGLLLVGGVNYRRLLNDAADSPVTRISGSPNQWAGGLGLAYSF